MGYVYKAKHNKNAMYPVISVYNNLDELINIESYPENEDIYDISFKNRIEGIWKTTIRNLEYNYTSIFTNADIINNEYICSHNLNREYPCVQVLDNNEKNVSVQITYIDSNTVSLFFDDTIDGNWRIIVMDSDNGLKEEFIQNDVMFNSITFFHSLDTRYPVITVYDNNDEIVDVVIKILTKRTFKLIVDYPIIGTWHLTAL